MIKYIPGRMTIDRRIFNVTTRNLYRNLCKKISIEHFNLTEPFDRNYNYLWFMYTKGTHAGETADFIIMAEISLLMKFGMIDDENFNNLRKMLTSTDDSNIYMALLSIKTLRKERIKKHGEFTTIDKISPEFAEIAKSYSEYVTPNSIKVS